MKNILATFVLLTCLSACIKTEDVACNTNPASPVLSSSSISAASNSTYFTFNNNILSPQAGATYYWTSPLGEPFSGSTLSYYNTLSPVGIWTVVANINTCHSDTTKFIVSQAVPVCEGYDSIYIFAFGYHKMVFSGEFSNEYIFYDASNSSNTLYINFSSIPTAGVYSIIVQGSTPEYNQCTVSFNTNSDDYSSTSGTLYVSLVGSAHYFTFCQAEFQDLNFDTYTISGYLNGN